MEFHVYVTFADGNQYEYDCNSQAAMDALIALLPTDAEYRIYSDSE